MDNFKKKTVSGVKWVAFGNYAQKAMTFGSFIVLARLLEPEVFGLFAMAFIVIDGLNLFKNMGVDAALVQRKDDVERASHTAFWMMPIMGVVIFALLYFMAPVAAVLLREESITPVLRCLGIIFVLGSIQSVPQSLLNKELKFRELEIRTLISTVLYVICAITLAYLQFGVWSLVYAYLVRRFSMLILTWTMAHYTPKMIFDKKIALELLQFGKFIFGSSIVLFLMLNVDNFLVGRMLGVASLGFYALAYNISDLTTSHLSNMITWVMFPAYSKIQDDKKQIKEINMKIIKTIAIFSVPFGLMLMLMGEELVGTVYGTKWLPIVPAIKILAICSILLPIESILDATFTALSKPKWSFNLRLTNIVLMCVTLPVMISWKGLVGAAIAVTFSKVITIPVKLYLARNLLGIKIRDILGAVQPVFFSAIIMIISTVVIKNIFLLGSDRGFLALIKLAGVCFPIIAIYGLVLFLFDKAGVMDIKKAVCNG